jgi:hypothetical protein
MKRRWLYSSIAAATALAAQSLFYLRSGDLSLALALPELARIAHVDTTPHYPPTVVRPYLDALVLSSDDQAHLRTELSRSLGWTTEDTIREGDDRHTVSVCLLPVLRTPIVSVLDTTWRESNRPIVGLRHVGIQFGSRWIPLGTRKARPLSCLVA